MASPEFNAYFHVLVKPVGPVCNLDCRYCYYLPKKDLYPGRSQWRMSDRTLECYVRQYVESLPESVRQVTFSWQGGEPTLAGLDFFRRAVELQRRHVGQSRQILNTIQTNGLLLDERWCRFFRENNFLVGLSVDGPPELHDAYRVDKQGRPTFDRVLRALKLLKQYQVDFNALVVVHDKNAGHGARVYRYLRDRGVRFFQFIPLVERRGGSDAAGRPGGTSHGGQSRPARKLVTARSVAPEAFGQFLVDVFDVWVRSDVGRVFVQIFEQTLAAWLGQEPSLCIFRPRCGDALVLEHNGDLFSCDHFVDRRHWLGNVHQVPLAELARSERQQQFGLDKQETLPAYCRRCEVRFVCNGECPKNRFVQTPDGEPGLNFLCAGYRRFFNFVRPYVEQMVEQLRSTGRITGLTPNAGSRDEPSSRTGVPTKTAARTNLDRSSPAAAKRPLSRNAPCPCGSGLKYKKCCLAKNRPVEPGWF